MDSRVFLDFLKIAERLKCNTRHSYTSSGRHESVAEHSWMMTLMAFFMKNEFPDADMNKVIQMCIIHDLGECFTGDIPTFMKTKEHEHTEENLLNEWVESLPKATQVEMKTLFKEMEERKSIESKIYKAIDSLEALIQHNFSDISTWSAWHALSSLYMQLCAAHFIERLSFGEPQELLLVFSLCSKLVQHVS